MSRADYSAVMSPLSSADCNFIILARSHAILAGWRRDVVNSTPGLERQVFSRLEFQFVAQIKPGLGCFGETVHKSMHVKEAEPLYRRRGYGGLQYSIPR